MSRNDDLPRYWSPIWNMYISQDIRPIDDQIAGLEKLIRGNTEALKEAEKSLDAMIEANSLAEAENDQKMIKQTHLKIEEWQEEVTELMLDGRKYESELASLKEAKASGKTHTCDPKYLEPLPESENALESAPAGEMQKYLTFNIE